MEGEDRLSIITEGLSMGVSTACKKHGISRTLFYRWLKRYKEAGLSGLSTRKRASPPHNKTAKEIVGRILALAKRHPRLGPREIMYRLEEQGLLISESAVYNSLKLYGLTTRQARLRYARGRLQHEADGSPIFHDMTAGECWILWITAFASSIAGHEVVYEFTVFDYRTRIACSRLYGTSRTDNFANLLNAVAIPIAHCLELDPRHFCIVPSPYLAERAKRELGKQLEALSATTGLDAKLHMLFGEALLQHIEPLRKAYTSAMSSSLLPLMQSGCSFQELKFALQSFVRTYNFRAAIDYGTITCSPIEYLANQEKREIILPIWAYLDRDY